MAGGASNNSGGMISGINMTPLVDIMLVLLIIFIVTAKMSMSPPSAIPMTLPKSSTGDSTVQMVFALALGKDGAIGVNDQRLPNDDALLPMAQAELAKHPDLRAVIQADGKVFHERIIRVLDLLSKAGVSQIAFGVTLSDSKP